MNKINESKKITALSVVIFSFVSIAIGAAVFFAFNAVTALIILKTTLSENILKIGSIFGSAAGIITAVTILTIKSKVKGWVASLIVALVIIIIKAFGSLGLGIGNYFTLNGLIGIAFTLVFSLIGGILGANLRRF